MVKYLLIFLTITRSFIVASVLAMATVLSIWSSSAVAQNDVRTSTEGDDTFVKRTYDDKTGKLLEVVKYTETWDPTDRTKIWKKVTTKKYDQGKRPHYETMIDEQEIVLDGRKRVVRKRTTSTTAYTKNKQRDLVINVEEEKELVGFETNGKSIYTGTRVTSMGKGPIPEKNEVWDVRTRKWVRVRPGLEQLVEEQRKQLLEAHRLTGLKRPKKDKEKIAGPEDKRIGGASRNKGNHYAVDDELNRTVITSNGDEKSIKNCKPRVKAGTGKSGCLAMVLPYNRDACLAYYQHQSGVCVGITDPRDAPIQQECWKLLKSGLGNLSTRNIECGCDRQCHEALASDLKKLMMILKVSLADAKSEKDCKSSGGLIGAMDCVTKRIEGTDTTDVDSPKIPPASASSNEKNTGITTTSVRNADGTRTITKTDKDGKVLSKETVGKSAASASSTDPNTGITTTSKRNADGTRTVTRTDKDGIVLSRKTVGNSPASASSTDLNTKVTIKSVANPDGSRTVTKTDKDGKILSREKVR